MSQKPLENISLSGGAASEFSGRPIRARLSTRLRTSAAWACALAPAFLPGLAAADPVGGVVAHGSADIAHGGGNTLVTQHTDRAVIDWQSFNINQGETTRFVQPGAGSVAVNRIGDANPSVIQGQLTANGQVVLLNPNGVVFGKNAKVDVQGLVASTAKPSAQDAKDWAEGRRNDLPLSVAGAKDSMILNAGTITAGEAGLVGFVAPSVVNEGVIRATKGKVHLASGDTATLDLQGDGLVNIAVSDDTRQQLSANHGLIEADGGTVILSAAAGKHVANGVINMDGVIQAKSLQNKNGRIILSADGSNAVTGNVAADKGKKTGSSKVTVSGRMDVSGTNTKGGSIAVTGDRITVKSTATLDASGGTGGGSIHLGGAYQGKGTTATAQTLTVESGATINADALASGAGGEVILWSDGDTQFHGSIHARGISEGGFVETSGHDTLNVLGGIVDLQDSFGRAGTWFLDPTDITLYNRTGTGDGTNSFTTAQLETMSSSANVSLTATNNITLDLTSDTLNLASGRDLTLTAGSTILSASAGTINTAGAGSINFIAGNNVTLNHAVNLNAAGSGSILLKAANNITSTGGGTIVSHGGAITLNSDSDASAGTTGGAILLGSGSNVTSNGGAITFGGGTSPLTGSAWGNGTYAQGISLTGLTVNSNGGLLTMHGQGSLALGNTALATAQHGIYLSNATLQNNGNGGNPAITIVGTGGGSGTGTGIGVVLTGGSSLTGVDGNLSVTGTGGGAGGSSNNYGVLFDSAGANKVQSSGYGFDTVVGTGGNAGDNNHGIVLNSTGGGISSLHNGMFVSGGAGAGSNSVSIANTMGAAGVIGGASSTGQITIFADKLNFATLPSIQTTGDVTFRNFSSVGIAGAAGTLQLTTALLDAITAGSVTIGTTSDTTAITANAYSWNKTVNIINNARNISINGLQSMASGKSFNATTTGSGDIAIGTGAGISTSGVGTIGLTAAGQITATGTASLTTASGAIGLNAASGIGLSSTSTITSASGSVALTSTSGTIGTGIIGVGSGNLTLKADGIILGGNISGTGALSIQQSTASQSIRLNTGANDGTALYLTTTSLGYLANGWAGITLGRADSTGAFDIGATTWLDPLMMNSGNGIRVYGTMTGNDNASLTFNISNPATKRLEYYASSMVSASNITVNGRVIITGSGAQTMQSTGGAINITGNLILGSAASSSFGLTTTNQPISIGGNITKSTGIVNYPLTLNAGTGTINFGGTVDNDFNLTANGGVFNFNGVWG